MRTPQKILRKNIKKIAEKSIVSRKKIWSRKKNYILRQPTIYWSGAGGGWPGAGGGSSVEIGVCSIGPEGIRAVKNLPD